MNQNKEFYHQFKHDWQLLLKINSSHYIYFKCFKRYLSRQEIIDFLLAFDSELKTTDDFYLNLSDLLSKEMKTALKTLTNYQDYV